ncbi:hypothetical protein PsW64_04692 [Pseudovibrio sp. W64]|nr:hypothetical protein PsW64_04692 [Pseudovibrio sp. W64]
MSRYNSVNLICCEFERVGFVLDWCKFMLCAIVIYYIIVFIVRIVNDIIFMLFEVVDDRQIIKFI